MNCEQKVFCKRKRRNIPLRMLLKIANASYTLTNIIYIYYVYYLQKYPISQINQSSFLYFFFWFDFSF